VLPDNPVLISGGARRAVQQWRMSLYSGDRWGSLSGHRTEGLVAQDLPEEFEGERSLSEVLNDLEALAARAIRLRLTAGDAVIVDVRGPLKTDVSGDRLNEIKLSFSGSSLALQQAEHAAGQRLPRVDLDLTVRLDDFIGAQLQTYDGNDHFVLGITTGSLRVEITEE